MVTCTNYSKMTKDDFDRILYTRLGEETLQSIVNISGVHEIISQNSSNNILHKDSTPQTIIVISGVYEIVSRHFYNDILETWEYEHYIKANAIAERIRLWNPDFQRSIVLLNLLKELTEILHGILDEKLDKYVNLRALPVREFHRETVDKYSAYPIWTCDFEGSCLVGAEKFEIEPIDSILHRFGDE